MVSAMTDIGSNGGPPLGEEWVDYRHALMVATRECKLLSPRARYVAWAALSYMDSEGKGARPSVRTLAEITGYGVNTIAGLMAQVEAAGLVKIRRGDRKVGTVYETGQTYDEAISTYVKGLRGRHSELISVDKSTDDAVTKTSPPVTISTEAVTKQETVLSLSGSDIKSSFVTPYGDKTDPLSLSGGDKDGDKTVFVTDGSNLLSPNCGGLSPNCGGLSLPEGDGRIEDKKIREESPQPPTGGSHDFRRMFESPFYSDGVEVDSGGGVRLVNGTRAEWLERFDGDDVALDLATKEVAGAIQIHSRQPIKMQLERGLARIARETRDKDKRYAKAAAKNKKPAQLSIADVLAIGEEMVKG